MISVILNGCNGVMGGVVTELVKSEPGMEIVAGIDINTEEKYGYPVFKSLSECSADADVIIDFSSAKAMDSLFAGLKEKKIPTVLCSTGLSEEQLHTLDELSHEVAILKSANMSLGINLIFKVLKMISPMLYAEGFDIEILEKHHHRKIDAPSGTAIALADAINESMDEKLKYTFDRSSVRQARDPKEIGFSAVRGGNIVGEHDIIFAGTDEVVTISHQAASRAIFARGAVAAAKFLKGKPAGFYSMSDVVDE